MQNAKVTRFILSDFDKFACQQHIQEFDNDRNKNQMKDRLEQSRGRGINSKKRHGNARQKIG